MRYQSTYAPIRTTSRAVNRKRARRALYFVLGTAFGLGCASALTPASPFTPPVIVAEQQVVHEPVIAATEQPAPAIAEIVSAPVLIAQPEPTQEEIQAAAAEPVPQYPMSMDLKLDRGDTLSELFASAGASETEAHEAIAALQKVYDLKKLSSGQRVSIELDQAEGAAAPHLASVTMPVSLTTILEVDRTADAQFKAKKIEKPLERKLAFAGGKIRSSLYQTAGDIGLPRGMVSEIINAFSYDVDFQRDIKSGDQIEVLYERMENYEGKHAGTGDLIFAELNMGGETVKIYRYEDKTGFADFYDEKGESVRKALLRTPISGARISSGYGMRNHPILGYNRMHRGVDFAAPIGTPIFAAGDGKVEFVGRKGGYGNFLKIAHNNKYSTAYAHLSRFANGIAPGKRVRQGQIVAYVGNTGSSTGAHLHYEVHVNGDQVNPSGVRFKTGNVLKGTELAAFKRSMEKIEAKVEAVKKGSKDIAMADFKRDVYSN
ncbi:MAG: peptidoglycan DD-metalloendopeptidase family protein [Rickettsiales bacterium]|jgi:murein DD-endopeptidase MepM/ murein hydrolase activator NlpD|nr:peptidoglycan DD-metalloendopeptidase family protein [Rickettsiales bacterium]